MITHPSNLEAGYSTGVGGGQQGGGGTIRGGASVRRYKTLNRPHLAQPQHPLVHPPQVTSKFDPWRVFSKVITFWAPDFVLRRCGRSMSTVMSRQAWREKIALCSIALLLWGFVAFYTLFMRGIMCPTSAQQTTGILAFDSPDPTLGIQGWHFNISTALVPAKGPNFYTLANAHGGQDITNFFQHGSPDVCNGLDSKAATQALCFADNGFDGCPLGPLQASTYSSLKITNTSQLVGFTWDQISLFTNAIVLNGVVLNMDPYINGNPDPIANDTVDEAIRSVLQASYTPGGRDVTHLFLQSEELKANMECLMAKYIQGYIDKDTAGCFFSDILLYVTLVVIFCLVLTRFLMAVVFSWFMAPRLAQTPRPSEATTRRKELNSIDTVESPSSKLGRSEWMYSEESFQSFTSAPPPLLPSKKGKREYYDFTSSAARATQVPTVMLVTAYSEGEEGLKSTLRSLAETEYCDDRKIIFVVCDGIVRGAGETRTTPEIALSLIEHDASCGSLEPEPSTYLAVGGGEKAINAAKVYAGWYIGSYRHRTPVVIIVKVGGTKTEEKESKKPGNRGKRDSQMILINFFHRVMYNDRMTPLDYELFRKVTYLMGSTPDMFEYMLMVDADTRVYKNSLRKLSNCMQNDPR